jgi:hypothetical protein
VGKTVHVSTPSASGVLKRGWGEGRNPHTSLLGFPASKCKRSAACDT